MSKQLKLAIEKDDADLVRQALKSVKNLNRALPSADKPLQYACAKGAAKAAKVLLEAGARCEAHYGFSPFDIAAEHGHIRVMEVLCRMKKADLSEAESALDQALLDGKEKVVQFILEQFKPEIRTGHFNLAVTSGKAAVLKLLVQHGGDINAANGEGNTEQLTALHGSARGGDPKEIRLLLEHGADVNVRDRIGRTPLMHLAADMGYLMADHPQETRRAVRTLLELGADASLTDNEGNDVITLYQSDMRRSREEIDPKVIQLFRKAGAGGGGAVTALFEAIADDDANAVKTALLQKVDLTRRNPFGSTPLTYAAGKGATHLVQLLLEAGADPNAPDRSETPLISAARSGHLAVVKQLIAAGARLDELAPGDDDDPTPRRNALLAAQWSRKFDVVDYLKSLGATKPKPSRWKPLQPGVASWNDFEELLVKADVETTAHALAKLVGANVQANAYGKTFKPGKQAYVVVRPAGMDWCNVFQVAPQPKRFESPKDGPFAKKLAATSGASVLIAGYSDTADAAAFQRFEPDGSSIEDQGWDRESLAEMVDGLGQHAPAWARQQLAEWDEDDPGPSSTERLKMLAETERFVVAAFGLMIEPGRPVDVEFTGYPAEAFDGVAIVNR